MYNCCFEQAGKLSGLTMNNLLPKDIWSVVLTYMYPKFYDKNWHSFAQYTYFTNIFNDTTKTISGGISQNVLLYASGAGHVGVIKYLCKHYTYHKFDILAALDIACADKQTNVVKYFIEAGYVNTYFLELYRIAFNAQNIEILQCLDSKFTIDKKEHVTCSYHACGKDNYELAKYFVDKITYDDFIGIHHGGYLGVPYGIGAICRAYLRKNYDIVRHIIDAYDLEHKYNFGYKHYDPEVIETSEHVIHHIIKNIESPYTKYKYLTIFILFVIFLYLLVVY